MLNRDKLYNIAEVIFQRAGLAVFFYQKKHAYVPLRHIKVDFAPYSAFDYRELDPFGRLAKNCIKEGKTLIGYDRLYIIYQSLYNMGRRVCGKPFGIAEIGVYRGGTTAFIHEVLRDMKIHPLWAYAIDTFQGHAAADTGGETDHPVHTPNHFGDTSYGDVLNYLGKYENISIIKGRIQDVVGQIDTNARFGFVHLDMDLYLPTLFALNFFAPLILPGGVIVVDDYGSRKCPGIQLALESFDASTLGFDTWHMHTEQAVMIKR